MASDAKTCFSSTVEYRAVIRYLNLKGKTGKEIHGELADVYGSSAPSYAQVKDNLQADQTWRRNMPPVHVIIKYQQKSQMKCVSHKLN